MKLVESSWTSPVNTPLSVKVYVPILDVSVVLTVSLFEEASYVKTDESIAFPLTSFNVYVTTVQTPVLKAKLVN
jgi:hypothetical protein